MERPRIARRRRDFPLAAQLWDEVQAAAGESNDVRIIVRARLETAHLQLLDEGDPDEALKHEPCLIDAKRIDFGRQRARVLQILGEIHRIKGNTDQARDFLNSARESARKHSDQCDEGWALLALAAIDHKRGETTHRTLTLFLCVRIKHLVCSSHHHEEKSRDRITNSTEQCGSVSSL